MVMSVIELLDKFHNIKPPTQTPVVQYKKVERLPRNSPNCTFHNTHNQPDVISILPTKSSFRFSMSFHDASTLPSIHPNSGYEFFNNYGDLFETNPWAQHTPDTLARRKYDSQMNITRAMI